MGKTSTEGYVWWWHFHIGHELSWFSVTVSASGKPETDHDLVTAIAALSNDEKPVNKGGIWGMDLCELEN